MKNKDLYKELKDAYSDNNLNQITGNLIRLYKTKNWPQIRGIANRISEYVLIDEEKISKCFSKLIMLYHPDKGEYYRNSIDKLYAAENFDKLNTYSHIFILEELDYTFDIPVDEELDYHPEYKWDPEEEGFKFFTDSDELTEDEEFYSEEDYERTFYDAVKFRMRGDIETEYLIPYLENAEEIELSECKIKTLDCIDYCRQATVLNLSNNEIDDLSDLRSLKKLEELYLSGNKVGLVDPLARLFNLRIIDLSDNNINDITELYGLEKLEYLNIIGNYVPLKQIDILKAKNIIVMH